jgi:antitoxin PrlF
MNSTASATLVAESTLTDRYQTTVPDPIRRVLKLGKRDKLRYSVLPDGTVTVERVTMDTQPEDPAIGEFLGFLSRDLEVHPERLQAFDGKLRDRIQSLIEDVNVDLDSALSPDDE